LIRSLALALAILLCPFAAASAMDIERVVSPGGIEAWLVEEPSIPVVVMEVAWKGGTATDPADKAGLANMVSGLLDEGAGDLDSAEFQERLDDVAAKRRSSAFARRSGPSSRATGIPPTGSRRIPGTRRRWATIPTLWQTKARRNRSPALRARTFRISLRVYSRATT
jgi:hypothetical protein